ncbi:MAG: phytanoyl-CoA dioxygenase family protein [Steroidobacteraceae bacterium]
MLEATEASVGSSPTRGETIERPLSSEQVEEFFRQGFLVVRTPRIPMSQIAWCRNLLMRMFERDTGRNEGRNVDLAAREGGKDGPSPQIFRPSLYARELSEWPFRKTGLAIAKQLLGPEATLAADNAVFKPSGNGGPTPWHQDEAYNNPQFYERQVTIWIALYDTTIENGAMGFIPRSHNLGILRHRLYGGSRVANSIECESGFNPTDAVMCPIPAGAMTIHHGRTLHGASGNSSTSPRLGYILNYKTPPTPRLDLGPFPWNESYAKSLQGQRRKWLFRGGMVVDFLRFIRSDRDNFRYLWNRLRKIVSRVSSRR